VYFEANPVVAFDAPERRPELVAPAVALLAHESCPCSGKYLEARGGSVTEMFLAQTKGYQNPELTLEDLAANTAAVLDRGEYTPVPDSFLMPEDVVDRFKPYQPA
jgi:hypothetical protein